VLLVDDDADARDLLAALLGEVGAQPLVAGGASEALVLLAQHCPHLIVSDVEMGADNGHSLMRRVRALAPAEGGDTPAVALTAHVSCEDRAESLRAGFDAHLTKPVDPNQLLSTLAVLARRIT
jgi:CheY-like chemotaxis protein